MDVLADINARGLIQDHTDLDALAARVQRGPLSLYYGCDPSADSLHIGNLIGLLVLRRFQLGGHRPIALAGGATGMIGDPGGRSEERNLLDADTLAGNVASIKAQITQVLGPEGEWTLVDNLDWTRDVSLLAFLRDVGKYMTVNQMLAKESVRARVESTQGISFTEFSYMLLQANDYWWLHEHFDCELQIGGSDQWGNITAGVELIRRRSGVAVHALTWPLLLQADGSKYGKTASGDTIWLGAHRTSPYKFFQFWMNVPDHDVEKFLLQLTLLPVEEAGAVAAQHAAAPERRDGQRTLAREVTSLVHGPPAAAAAESASAVLFGSALEGVDAATLDTVAGEVPTTSIGAEEIAAGLEIADVLVRTGLASSRSDARRLLEQGGVYVNNLRIEPGHSIGPQELLHGRFVLLRRGRQYHLLVSS